MEYGIEWLMCGEEVRATSDKMVRRDLPKVVMCKDPKTAKARDARILLKKMKRISLVETLKSQQSQIVYNNYSIKKKSNNNNI